ncbi:MAG: ABC transporter permease [bacterium]|nr:MAG: ABC transporter permease [bacterium]
MKYLHLILRNLTRKKLRAVLTIGSFMVALFLFGMLVTIDSSLSGGLDVASANRLVIRNKVSLIMPLPISYAERMRQMEGIEEVTHFVWFGGVYQDAKNFFANYTIEPETVRRVYPEYLIPDEQWDTFLEDRQAALVGKDLAKRFGWKVGDRVPLEGTIWQGVWEFNVRGIYDVSTKDLPTSDFWFHYDYLEEQRPFLKGTTGWYTVRVTDPSMSADVAGAIDERFANSPYETKTETERAFIAGFVNQMGNIRLLMISIGSVVFFTLLLVTGNTMAISVRERFGEIAVMKTVGFSDGSVLGLIIAESFTIAALGSVIGLGLAKLVTLGGDPTGGILQVFYLGFDDMALGFGLSLVVGIAAGLIPGLNAMRLRIVDALRRV